MMPTDKNPEIENFLGLLTGKNRRDTIMSNMCMTCDGEAPSFRDEVSRKEYMNSGMCQKCQDEYFGVNEDEEDFSENA